MKRPTHGGFIWWCWALGIIVVSWFIGGLIGKGLRKVIWAWAIPETARIITALFGIVVSSYLWGQLVGWIDRKLFPFKTISVRYISSRPSASKQVA